MPLVEARALTKAYPGAAVLRGVSASLEEGTIYGLIGPNGSGKTTLFNLLSGFARPTSGSVHFDGRPIDHLWPEHRWRLGLARSFQDNRLALRLTVAQNLALAMRGQVGEDALSAVTRPRAVAVSNDRTRARVLALLTGFDLEHLVDRIGGTLSLGQQKLISILCCVASEPRFLLLDEPAAALSPALKEKVLTFVLSHVARTKAGALIIDHDLSFIERISSRVLFMNLGQVVATGTLKELRNRPEVVTAYLSAWPT